MKLITICAFAAVACAHGPVEIHGESNHLLEVDERNPYKYLLRSRRNDQICTPGSIKEQDCNDCICPKSGYGWLCTLKMCVEAPSDHQVRDFPVIRPHEAKRLERTERDTAKRECYTEGTLRQKLCNTCFCDSEGFFSICISTAQCDPENTEYQASEMTNLGHDFNIENYILV